MSAKPPAAGCKACQPGPASQNFPLRVAMIAPILRSGFVREDFVVNHVVMVQPVPGRSTDGGRTHPQIADQCRYRDVDDIVSETPSVRPTAGNGAAAKTALNRAGEGVAAEDTQPRETRVVRICRMIRAAARESAWAGREIDLNQIGDVNAHD